MRWFFADGRWSRLFGGDVGSLIGCFAGQVVFPMIGFVLSMDLLNMFAVLLAGGTTPVIIRFDV